MILAWQTANFQGVKVDQLEEILRSVDTPAPQKRAGKTPEELMLTMAKWRVAMADPALRHTKPPTRPRASRSPSQRGRPDG